MKIALLLAILVTGLWAANCLAQQEATPKSGGDKAVFHIAVDLDDGSHLVGTLPADTRIAVQSPGLQAGIAIKRIDTITMSDDHKTAVIALQNSDQIKVALAMKTLTLAMEIGDVPVDMRFVKTMNVFEPDAEGTQGLVFWNTLASEKDALHSAVGPGLKPYAGGRGPDGTQFAANREYIAGDRGGAVMIGGAYPNPSAVHDLVLSGLDKLINPEQGCAEVWYYQVARPVRNLYGIYRLLDGACGFDSCVRLFVVPEGIEFALRRSGYDQWQRVSFPIEQVAEREWIHLAAAWNRKGIEGTRDTMRLYLNGKLVASSTETGWVTTTGKQADICGSNDDKCPGKFLMNNLKIWNRARTNFDMTAEPDIVPKNMPPIVPPVAPPPQDDNETIRMPKTVE